MAGFTCCGRNFWLRVGEVDEGGEVGQARVRKVSLGVAGVGEAGRELRCIGMNRSSYKV